MRKTRIVCTPSTDDVETLSRLPQSGVNVARFNMAHGDHEEHGNRIARVRVASRRTGIAVASLMFSLVEPV